MSEGLCQLRHVPLEVPLDLGVRLHLQDAHGLAQPTQVLLEDLLRLQGED